MKDVRAGQPVFLAVLLLISNCVVAAAQVSTNEMAELNQKFEALYQAGKYPEALPVARQALELTERNSGPEHLDTANTLGNLGTLYYQMSDYGKAEPLFQRALKIRETKLGPKHPDIAKSLNNLATIYCSMHDYTKAKPLYRRALTIYETTRGREHLDTAASLSNLADLYRAVGDYAKAEPLYQRTLAIYEKLHGPEHADTTISLSNLADLYHAMGDYAKAEPLYQQALAIREKKSGLEHPDTATSLNDLADLYRAMGDYTKAEPLFQRALKIRKTKLGPEHPDTAIILSNLARIYHAMGDYAKAEPLYQQELAIYEKASGLEHPDTATSLSNLARFYHDMGDYAKAESFHLRSLRICEKTLGPEHLNTAINLNNLASLYTDTGDFAKAELLYRRNLKIYEKALPEHPNIASSLCNLADLYSRMGDCAKAEPLCQRALKIREAKLGPEHPDTAKSLSKLAFLYDNTGDYAKAESLFQRALKIRETKLGPEHPDTASSLNSLAWLYHDMGNYAKAEPLYQQALAIYEKALGPECPATASSLNNLALLYDAMGDFARAEPLYQRALKLSEKARGSEHPYTSGTIRNLSLLQLDKGRSDLAYPFAVKYRVAAEKNLGRILAFTSERQRMAYRGSEDVHVLMGTLGSALELGEILLRTKGVVLDSLLEDQLAAEASKNPEIKTGVDQLRVASRQLTQLQIGISEDLTAEALKRRQAEREALEQQVEDLQKALARNVAAIGQVRRALRIKISDVQAVLPEKTVLMEFVRYSHYVGKGKFEPRYGVVLIGGQDVAFKDAKPDEPVWVPLGSAAAIEQSLKEYGSMMRGKKESGISLLHKLYTQLFEPIQKRLPKDIATLIISPDAELNFVSFATFVDDQDKFLAEQYAIEYVASGRDLVLKRTTRTGSRRFAAFANPAFGEKPLMAGTHSTNAVQLAMLSSDLRDYRGEILKPLPYTMQEAKFLRDRSSSWNMDGSVYAGAEATEAEVKAVKSPYILHLATHGFFLSDTLATTNHPAAGRQLLGNDRAPIVPHNPMQRSGLAFAGAQLTLDAWKRGETPDTENDGILMGQEIGTMDLKGTWLVVLSACDTGIGEARAGEGVLGLRRGFIQAGAQNLLMTLWPVSDRGTVDLMKAFYERALKDNNAPQALAEVQRQWLVRLRQEEDILTSARLAGPFILTFQGSN